MSDQTRAEETSPGGNGNPEEAPAQETLPQKQERRKDPVRRWTMIILAICAALTVWYVIGDRLTPFTSQARVEAYVVPIAPEVSGTVSAVDVGNNQFVEAGERLLQIDVSRYALTRDSAAAELLATQQELDAAFAGLVSAEANLKSARADLEKDRKNFERLENIFEEDPGAVSKRRLDGAVATLESAKARVEAAEAELKKARLQLGPRPEENPRLLAAQAALEQASINLDRTTIVAPARGLVTDVRVDAGNFAQAGAPLMTFVAIHDVWIQANLTENNLGNLKSGDDVEFVLDVRPGRVYKGKVRSIGFGVSTGNDSLGTLPTIQNQPNWLRDAQRFPVIIDLDETALEERIGVRVGSQATIIAYTGAHPVMNTLGRLYIRLLSYLSYLY